MTAGALEVRGVDLAFGGQQVLTDVSLDAGSGRLLGLIGPNGAGKTSLLNCISGIYRPDAGRITLAGSELSTMRPPSRVRHGLGRTFQHTQLLEDRTCLENVLVGRHAHVPGGLLRGAIGLGRAGERAAVERSMAALDTCSVARFADHPVTDLPYGHRKLVDLARALAGDPTVLLLDEPMAGLSRAERDRMVGVIEHVRRSGVTLVMIEHDVDVIRRLSDDLVVLDHGRVIATGAPSEVLERTEVVTSYLGGSVGSA